MRQRPRYAAPPSATAAGCALGRVGAHRLRGARGSTAKARSPAASRAGCASSGHARLEHCRVVGRFAAGEGEVGAAERLERAHRVGLALRSRRPPARPANRSNPRSATSASSASASRKCRYGAAGLTPAARAASAMVKPAGPFSRDQIQRGLDQRLAQVAVMVAAPPGAAVLSRPAHVNGFYITRRPEPAPAAGLPATSCPTSPSCCPAPPGCRPRGCRPPASPRSSPPPCPCRR